ncbi:MAG: adenylyl-sulfate kinase [Candidatus Dadabacteria bacterium]|nr:MAG: adenylyl-sulfate kinase [Candidatus Dadabacteria bacterium]
MDKGFVVWITGYAGAGKTTLARTIFKELSSHHNLSNLFLLDGDEFREFLSPDLGYTPKDRLENAWRIARLSLYLATHGINVITATVSMYANVRNWLREQVENYTEIYIKVSDETLIKRDKKNLYSKLKRGEISYIPGGDVRLEEPDNPHIVIENDSTTTAELEGKAREIARMLAKNKTARQNAF